MANKTLALPQARPFPLTTFLALLATYIFWGGSYLALRIAVQTMPPMLLGFSRFLFAGGFLMFALWQRGVQLPKPLHIRNGIIIGTLMFAGGFGLVSISSQWVASGLAALAVAVIPLWSTLLALVVEKSRPNRQQTLGLFFGLAGIVLLNMGGDFSAEPRGAILLFFAPISWAIGSILMRHLDLPDGLMGTATIMLGGSVSLLLAGLLRGETVVFSLITPSAILSWFYLVIPASLLAFPGYAYLNKATKPIVATSYAYVNPVIALLLGWLILQEQLTLQTMISAGIILVSVVLITTSRGDNTK